MLPLLLNIIMAVYSADNITLGKKSFEKIVLKIERKNNIIYF